MAKLPSTQSTGQPWGLWATLGLSLLVLLAFFLSQTAVFAGLLMIKVMQTSGSNIEELARGLDTDGFAVAIATFASTPICLLIVLGLARLRSNTSMEGYLGLHRPARRDLLEWCLVTIVFVVILAFLRSLGERPLSPSFVLEIYRSAQFLPLLYLTVGVMAPIFEEIFVRGFIFQGIHHSDLGSSGAVFFSALLWTLIHTQYDGYDMGSIFVFGLLLGIARLKTGSTYVAIAMHMLNNIAALLHSAVS